MSAPMPRTPATHERSAILTMYIGLALTVVAAIVPIIDQAWTDSLSQHLHDVYAGYDVDAPATSAVLAYLATVGALGTLAWLWTLWAVNTQRHWARPVATVLFLLACGLAIVNLTVQEYDQTILPMRLGLVGLLPCVAGLVAVVLLWRRE